MIIYENEKLPKGIEEKIIIDSHKDFQPITSYTLVNGCIDEFFYKKLNMAKIQNRYKGNYASLLIRYYESLQKYVLCNKLCGLIAKDNELFEISKRIDESRILCDNRIVLYKEMKWIFEKALEGIQSLEFSHEKNIGIDSSIWNYSKDGLLFDFDPPKILENDTLFVAHNDLDQKKRTIYRSFNYEGMRANSLATIILGNSAWNFKIKDIPHNYLEELIDIMLQSIENKDMANAVRNLIYGENEINDFSNHPIKIIRKELRKNEK